MRAARFASRFLSAFLFFSSALVTAQELDGGTPPPQDGEPLAASADGGSPAGPSTSEPSQLFEQADVALDGSGDGGVPADAPVATELVSEEPDPVPTFSTVVVGTAETRTSGSVHVLKSATLERFERDDPHAILRTVPGVYAREEDGFGLRPNIGLRGANSDRSKKVTLMEDGVLFGPAPYSAPAAYYFPIMTRMQSVRVLKGPSAVVFGPQSVGGAIDLVTRDITRGESFGIDVAAGEYLSRKVHARYGASTEHTGFLVEGVHLGSAGFKELDTGDETGFVRNEVMLKARHKFDQRALGKLELKLGYSAEESDETYLGLSDEDFRETPLRRYAASMFDHMSFDRTQAQLRHTSELGPVTLTTTLYRHALHRVWNKVNAFRGKSLASVLADPESSQNAVYYAVLTGAADTTSELDELLIGPNDRTFLSQGVQSVARWSGPTGPLTHDAELGARFHYDRIQRLHTQSEYSVIGGVPVSDTGPSERVSEVTADNTESAQALALHAIDAIGWGLFTVTPGLRAELIQSRAVERFPNAQTLTGNVNVLLPGVGVHAQVLETVGVFAGVYRGFSPPVPSQGAAGKPELSVNYEAGARWTSRGERYELLGFFNNYSNLTAICTESSGCDKANTDTQTDVGRAHIQGLEALAEKTFRLDGGISIPLSLAYTLTFTELLETFTSADPQFGSVRAGDEMPYVPRHQGSASAGVELPSWGAHLSATYVGAMREAAGQGETSEGEVTDALLTVDAVASWYPAESTRVYLKAQNLLNTHAIVSRRPFGARPNAPRTVQLGVSYSF